MKPGDKALYYHSPSGKKIFGIMRVTKPPYSDPASLKKDWLAVDFEPVKTFSNPITLTKIKSEPLLKNTAFVKQPRLSVMLLSQKEFDVIVQMDASS